MLTPVWGLALMVASTSTVGGTSVNTTVDTGVATDREHVSQLVDRLQERRSERLVGAYPMAAATAQASIPDIIRAAFAPLGPDAVTWGLRVGFCESTYNPDAVNPSSGTEGLFQFQPSTWAETPESGSSPFDAAANAQAAAWLFSHDGPNQWECQ